MPSPALLNRLVRLAGMIGRIAGPFPSSASVIEAIGRKLATGGWAHEKSLAPGLYAFTVLGTAIVVSPGDEPLGEVLERVAQLCGLKAFEAVLVISPNIRLVLPEEVSSKPVRRVFVEGTW